jgi:ABC-type phosphate/phosphonate transport system permease subunit
MQPYKITLQNEKKSSYKKSLIVLIILNFFAFLFLAWIAADSDTRSKSFFASGGLALSLLLDILLKNWKKADFKSAAIILAILYYIRLHYYWLAFALLLISLLFLLATRDLVVHVSAKAVYFPSLPRKIISWGQLNSILVKDGILTIDLKNNKLIQVHVDESKTSTDEKEFNEFCSKQLQSVTA